MRHEVQRASHSRSPLKVDLSDEESIKRLYAQVGRVDAVVCVAGQAAFRPLVALTDEDIALGLNNKLMGQVNLVRFGLEAVTDAGSFTLTSGILDPSIGTPAAVVANTYVEAVEGRMTGQVLDAIASAA